MRTYSKETIDALAAFETGLAKLPGRRIHDELIVEPGDAKLVTRALRKAFKGMAPSWVNGRYVGGTI